MNTQEAMERAREEFGPPRPAEHAQIPDLDYLTADEMAAILRCTKRHITKQAKLGKIPGAFQVGSLWRFHRKKIFSAG